MKIGSFIEEGLKSSFHAVNSNKFRAFLTTVGISIGIFAIGLVFTLVNSLESAITKNLAVLGNTTLYVHNWPWKDNSKDWFKYVNRPKVSYKEFKKLEQNLNKVSAVSFEATKNGLTLKNSGNSIENVTVKGITADFIKIRELNFKEGRYFSEVEFNSGRNVCILGYEVARQLLGNEGVVGKTVDIGGKKLKVIGVINREGNSIFGASLDEMVFIPYQLFAKVFPMKERRIDKVIAIKANKYENLEEVQDETIGIMRQTRSLKPSEEDNFAINKQEALMENLKGIFGALNTGGIFISALSLLVGGFGIANIMFVSVKERTREIGIKKAIGAKRSFILFQFLTEAVMLCLVGGAVGLILLFTIAGIAQVILEKMSMDFNIIITGTSIITSVLISVIIGIISGLIPSYYASKLDPVEAMR